MSRKQLILRMLFFGVVLALFAVPRTARIHARESGEDYGFQLDESAHALGIDFIHEVPTSFDPKIANLTAWFQAMSAASAAVCDVNGDGWPDIYVTNARVGSKNRLYINRGGTSFEEVADQAGIADVNRPGMGVSTGAACADYDNDGHEDLLLHKWGPLELFHNNGDGTLTSVTREAGLGGWLYSNDAIWWDFNRDACLDIYAAAYWRSENDFWHLNTTRIMHSDFNWARNGGRNKLYQQVATAGRCTGTFKDVSREYGVDDSGWSLAAGSADLDDNGFPDLYVANDFGPDALFLNVDGHRFKRVTQNLIVRYGIGHDTKKGMNVAFGDFENTGRLGIYVTNLTEPGFLVEGNMLWENLGNGRFRDVAWKTGAADGGWSWGAVFGDLNNDGYTDIYCANGMVSANPATDYWYDTHTMSAAMNLTIEDAASYPPMRDRSWSGYQRSRVFLNDGRGHFQDVAGAVGAADLYDGRGVARADLDRNGTLDVIVANNKGPLVVYLNHVAPGREWIQFRLRGTRSNRSAIGTHVTLHWNDQKQVQVVDGGGGYTAYSEKLLHFGLGEHPKLHYAEIRWPSGQIQVLRDLEPRKSYLVEEP